MPPENVPTCWARKYRRFIRRSSASTTSRLGPASASPLLDPLARRLEVFARAGDGWTRLEEHSGVATVSVPPFEEATIELAPLWG